MKKLMFIFLLMFFVFGMYVSSAIGADCYLKWDVGQDGSFDTTATLKPGETVTVDLWVTDIPDPGASSFEVGYTGDTTVGMKYDTNVLQCTSVTVNTDDWPLFTYADWTTTPGRINAGGCAQPGVGHKGDKKLITIEFQCLSEGSETFDFTENERFYLGMLGAGSFDVDKETYALTITCKPQGGNNPPVAEDQSVETDKNESIDITLEAIDPDNDPLTYIITSLPSNGSLKEGGTEITSVPYSLLGNTVTYTPNTDYTGSDSFTFKANDGKEDSNEATVSITVKEEGDFQSITPEPISINARPGDEFTFSVMYDASDSALTGLVFYVHYNSSYLDFVEASNIFEKGFMGLVGPEDDIDDKDNNPLTDKRFLIAWADLTPPPSWPGSRLPLSLMDITFHVKEWICPPFDTLINFTKKDTAQGYAFLSTPMKLHIVSFHLDIDDNGEVEALTDGLLVIRYLFGFRGEDLIDGAIGANANRYDPDEIADWIETGISEGYLDIDDNGAVTPLTDGLLLIRYLFGFRGEDLVIGATGLDGKRTEPSEIGEYIEENLMPF